MIGYIGGLFTFLLLGELVINDEMRDLVGMIMVNTFFGILIIMMLVAVAVALAVALFVSRLFHLWIKRMLK